MSQEAMWMWGGVAVAVIAAWGVVWSLGWDWWRTRGLRRAGKLRRCRKCLFDMSGVPGLVCPECGKKWKNEKSLSRVRRQWKTAMLAAALLFGALPIALWTWISSIPPRVCPTFVVVAMPPVVGTLRVCGLDDPGWYGCEEELSQRYAAGSVTWTCEVVEFAATRVQAFARGMQAERAGEQYSSVSIDMEEVSPEKLWRAEMIPRWITFPRQVMPNEDRSLWRNPSRKSDWTLEAWNRRRRAEEYDIVASEICSAVNREIEGLGAKGIDRYTLDLSGHRVVFWGDEHGVKRAPVAAKVAQTVRSRARRDRP